MAVQRRAPHRQGIERRAIDQDQAVHRLLGLVVPVDREVDDIGLRLAAEQVQDPDGRGIDRCRLVDPDQVGRFGFGVEQPLPAR